MANNQFWDNIYKCKSIKKLTKFIPEVKTIQLDLAKTLPFENESIGLIIVKDLNNREPMYV